MEKSALTENFEVVNFSDSIFDETLKNKKSELIVWEKKTKKGEFEDFEIVDYDKENKVIYLESNDKKSRLVMKKIRCCLSTKELQFITSGVLKNDEHTQKMIVELSGGIYKQERREDKRLIIENTNVSINLNKINFKVHDISIVGMGLIVFRGLLHRFVEGKTFDKVVMIVNKKKYKVPSLTVRHVTQKDDDHYIVGLDFCGQSNITVLQIFVIIYNLLFHAKLR